MNLQIDQAGDASALVRAISRSDGVNPSTVVELSVVEVIGPPGVSLFRIEVRAGSSLRDWDGDDGDDECENTPRTLYTELYREEEDARG